MIPIESNLRFEAMSPEKLAGVYRLEALMETLPQLNIETDHLFYAGLYARTICIPAGFVLTGVLIKIPTVVIVSGDCVVVTDDGLMPLHGYNVISGVAGRKQVFVTETDTHVTMLFATDAQSVHDAEEAFTDEAYRLLSRKLEI